VCSCHLTSVCLCSCNEYLPSFHISFCQWHSLRRITLFVQVLFATAFYQSPSRLTQSVMTQIAKLKIVRKEGWQVPWVASLQSLCAKDTSQRLRSSYVPLRKELLGIRNSRVLPNWRRAENWGTLYIAFPYWSTKIFLSAISSTTVIKEGYKGIYKVSCMSEHWLQLCFEICTECVEVILKLEFPVQWAQSPKIFQWWLLSMPTLPSDILLVAASKLTLFNVCSVERVFYL